MAVGVYFHKDVIMRDLEKFAKSIAERLNANVSVLDLKHNDEYLFGYIIYLNGKRYLVYMSYDENEFGEFAIKNNDWTIELEDGHFRNGYRTLGEVFEFITGGKQ
jgi:hypothetical protein